MGFDLTALASVVDVHGPVVRIVIAETKGSAPRDAGTSMLVWADGQSGTIGGGTLEFQAIAAAKRLLGTPGKWRRAFTKVPLGPALGQCCGGAVSLLAEVYGPAEVANLTRLASGAAHLSRPVLSGPAPTGAAATPHAMLAAGRLAEPFAEAEVPLWIYGAGHVGRALVWQMQRLGFAITWVDTDAGRFPDPLPDGITPLIAARPNEVVRYAPPEAMHLIVTYSHALDLELCHVILGHSFRFAGLIGSATKWTRFRARLAQLGHAPVQIARITCPIGLPELGKEPESIAVGVAAQLLKERVRHEPVRESAKEMAQ